MFSSAQLRFAMLKPSDPSGSAFLKVDPTYIQHWQQLFPQTHLKNAALTQLQPPDRITIPVESFRQRQNLISSTTSSSALTPSSTSSSTSSVSSLAGLTQLPVPPIALFGQTLCSDIISSDSTSLQAKEVCVSSSFKSDKGSRFKLTSEEQIGRASCRERV